MVANEKHDPGGLNRSDRNRLLECGVELVKQRDQRVARAQRRLGD
jgi:hypothetical protein